MKHPTDDELETEAVRLEDGRVCSPAQNSCRNGYLMLDAAAMLRACKGRVRVKPLEWVKHPSRDIWRCYTMLGAYKVFGVGAQPSWDFDAIDGQKSEVAASVEAAKAAAQADYERRILAALEPAPDHSDWNAAIEAAALTAFDCVFYDSAGSGFDEDKFNTAIDALKKGPSHD